jgi:phosphoadenosine phosphosulfate reductase
MDARERDVFLAWSTLPKFKRKVERSLEVIREALAIGPAYVSVSWGKDSVVMLHLCQQIQSDILAVHIGHKDQELIDNYADVIDRYCAKWQTNHCWIKGDQKNAKEGIEHLGIASSYPVALIGMRTEESSIRRKTIGKNGLIYQYTNGKLANSYRCTPIAYWDWKDVWAYIVSRSLPYLASYDHMLNADRSTSRTAVHYSSGRGSQFGRLSKIQVISPDYYRLLKQQIPEIG